MKQILSFSLLFLFIILNNACTDKCKDVNCNNGICIEGKCSCDFGWKGDACDNKMSSKFLGDWNGVFDCLNNPEVTIKFEDIPEELLKINMHTVGLSISVSQLTLDFDNYVFTANIDSTFSRFDIDTLPVQLTWPPTGQEVNLNITGDGQFLQDSTLNIDFEIIATSPVPYTLNCAGNFKK